MPSYKSALGRSVDIHAIIAKNEHVRAVGNMKVNARGDTIDSNNRIIKPSTDKVSDKYNKTLKNAGVGKQIQKQEEPLVVNEVHEPEEKIDTSELESQGVFEQDDIELEEIKKQDKN